MKRIDKMAKEYGEKFATNNGKDDFYFGFNAALNMVRARVSSTDSDPTGVIWDILNDVENEECDEA